MSNPWNSVKLGELLSQVSRDEPVDPTRGYRLLGVRWYGQGLFAKETKRGQEIRSSRLYRVRAGDFVYNRLFAWKGSFALAGEEFDGSYVSNEFPCFQVDAARLDPTFLMWYFRQTSNWGRALSVSVGATPTSRNRLKEKSFLNFDMPLPPLAEQVRIVERVEKLARKITEAESLQNEYEHDSRQLLAAAFSRIIDGAPYRPLEELAPLTRRPVPVVTDGVYPQVAARSFGRGTFHRPPLLASEITWQKPYLVRNGDIVISNIKAWEGAVAVARQQDDGRVASHRYLTCVPVEGMARAAYVQFYLLTPEGLEQLGKASPGSADRNRTLGAKALQNIAVPAASYTKQQSFEALCDSLQSGANIRREALAQLDRLLPAVLSRIFRGEL